MAKILLAASPEPREILHKMLAGHELSCVSTLAEAEGPLSHTGFDEIVCTLLFDESRMFDFLRLVKERPELRAVPFVCARMRPHVLDSKIAIEGIAFTCRALGAAAFLDIADYDGNPEQKMRSAIESFLPA